MCTPGGRYESLLFSSCRAMVSTGWRLSGDFATGMRSANAFTSCCAVATTVSQRERSGWPSVQR